MHRFKALKYSVGFVLPFLAWVSFQSHGFITFLPLLYTFFLLPALELLLPANQQNMEKSEEASRLDNVLYDILVYLIVPVQLFVLVSFLFAMQEPQLTVLDIVGRVSAMGLCCGILGINVGHELGHRSKWY